MQGNDVGELIFHSDTKTYSGFEFGVIRVVADIAAEVKTGFYIERQLRKTHRAKQRK